MLSKEIAAYERMRDELEANHMDKWVVVHDRSLIGIYDSFHSAAVNAVRRFGRGPYLIRQVGEKPLILPPTVFLSASAPDTRHALGSSLIRDGKLFGCRMPLN